MNRKITRLARAGKCGGLGASGSRGTASSVPPRAPAARGAVQHQIPASASTLRQPQRTEAAADPAKKARRGQGRAGTDRRDRSRSPGRSSLCLHGRATSDCRSVVDGQA